MINYIILLLINYLIHIIGRWVPAGRCKEPNLTVSNLIPGQEYTFRVSAVNSEGESEPLVADHSIIAKNPFGMNIYLFDENNSN